MAEYQLPEMLRTPLEELCLQIKLLKLGAVAPFIAKALQPADERAINNALSLLRTLGALTDDEQLTALGFHLATLPVNPRIGKMILFAAIFGCLDPVLTIAASLSFRDPFVIPLNKQQEADRVRKMLAADTKSDHLTFLRAFDGWMQARAAGREKDFCWQHFLSSNTLNMISHMKQQFAELLVDIGFVDKQRVAEHNRHARDANIIKAVMCAGLYPSVARVDHPHGKNFGKRPPKLYTKQDGKVALHPRSVIAEEPILPLKWLLYHQKVKSSKVFLYDATMISPLPLLLFGHHVERHEDQGQAGVAVDGWIVFRCAGQVVDLVQQLRRQLESLLDQKIRNPKLPLSEAGHKLTQATISLLSEEDHRGMEERMLQGRKMYDRRRSSGAGGAAGAAEDDGEEDEEDDEGGQEDARSDEELRSFQVDDIDI
eukprot:m.199119 g.199119  ORF g.199119 m.199119 type:complete len:428 (+) comp21894_c0_seq1:135-1418(+)